MRIILIIKAIAGSLVLGAMGGTAYLMQEYTGTVTEMPGTVMEQQRQVELNLKQKAEQGIKADNEPGEKAFKRAKDLLAMGSMAAAEEKLKYIVSFYPSAMCAPAARKILGEINVDRLLDPDWKKGKSVIQVKSGDTFTRIVRQNKTTMDSLVHLSKLMRADHRSLHPGDKLTVMPLEMRVVIDLRRKTLTLWRGEEFIKEYPVKKVAYRGKAAVKRLKIDSIRGWHGGKVYPSHAEEYTGSNKVITLSDKSLAIRAVSDENQDDMAMGFLLSRADVEELPLLLRPSNDIEIRQ
ncbi:MAG: LysM domain-containing protein [Verrucomicrobiae bacterium]|nr:LysM domain-containing protein [Verrucomicrobiae bacterium]NNJ43789.1 LysM peptidoglycan-binding domain-containing protein [Akkermansiaceae bacterium]